MLEPPPAKAERTPIFPPALNLNPDGVEAAFALNPFKSLFSCLVNLDGFFLCKFLK